MTKIVIILYLVVLSLYIFFTRQPDFFDGEFTTGTVHFIQNKPEAIFSSGTNSDTVDAAYLFRNFKENETVKIIYDNQDPSNAAVYDVWGYWVRWQEMLFSIVLIIGLFQVAVQVTKNPTAEALINEMEGTKKVKKRKYDD